MKYYETKVFRKRIIVQEHSRQSHSDYLSPRYDAGLEDSNTFILYDTPPYDDVSPDHVWLRKVQQFTKYRPDKH